MKFALLLSDCDAAVEGGLREANREGWQIVITIVDDSGVPVRLSRMDEASAAAVKTAIEKARSAALTGVETKLLEAMVKDRPAVVTMGRVAVEGGIPILHKGQRVGGIGVSGVQSHQDAQVARAALAAFDASS